MNFWTVILVVIAVIILLITCSPVPDLNDYISSNKNLLKYVNINEFLKECDNGDIILMCGNTRGERGCRWVTNCKFSHVAIVFRETNENGESVPYIWESDLGCKSKDGPRIMRLDDKLRNYHGYKNLSWRKLKCDAGTPVSRPTTQDIMNIVGEMRDYKFDIRMLKWFTSSGLLKPFHHLFYDETKKFCSELVAETFQKLGVFKNMNDLSSKHACWYSPKNFDNKDIIGLRKGYSFGDHLFVDFLEMNYVG